MELYQKIYNRLADGYIVYYQHPAGLHIVSPVCDNKGQYGFFMEGKGILFGDCMENQFVKIKTEVL